MLLGIAAPEAVPHRRRIALPMATRLAPVPAIGQGPEPGTSTGSASAHENQPKLVQNLGELARTSGKNEVALSSPPYFSLRFMRRRKHIATNEKPATYLYS